MRSLDLTCTKDSNEKVFNSGRVTTPNPHELSLNGNQWKWADGMDYNGLITPGNGSCAFLRRVTGFNRGIRAIRLLIVEQ
ncbi:unnamed protein product, partial [Mesorhabditis belari]|uniref:Uncharacterized protein n=1 Tax=Mesorhabditis belari TaxID=2138241 RepID=A0AAF3F4Q7_9BILA